MTACLTVYLVDDDADVRDALAFLLGSRGLTVLSFDSRPAARRLPARHSHGADVGHAAA